MFSPGALYNPKARLRPLAPPRRTDGLFDELLLALSKLDSHFYSQEEFMRKVVLVLGLLFFTGLAVAQKPAHKQQCSNATAQGSYGFTCYGMAPNPFNNYAIEPFAFYGIVTGDGKGQWNGSTSKASFNGTIVSTTVNTRLDDPAVVNADCSGHVTYEMTAGGYPAPDAHFDFVIIENGDKIEGFPTDAGNTAVCHLIKNFE
jgi:hypothetical protein